MKKYFVKYIPVEGEVKVGEKCLTKEGSICTPISIKQVERLKDILTPLKLFLCSRDIQVGHKFIHVGYNNEYPDGSNQFEATVIVGGVIQDRNQSPWIVCDSKVALKVIGEISPKATWVKDGDEFTKEQVQITHKVGFKQENVLPGTGAVVWKSPYKSQAGLYWKWYEEMEYYPLRSNHLFIVGHQNGTECKLPADICMNKSTVKIQCPTCKNFH